MQVNYYDLIGQRVGRLVVTAYLGPRNGVHRYMCTCDCGGKKSVARGKLKNRLTKSCGCLLRETQRKIANNSSKAFFWHRRGTQAVKPGQVLKKA